MTQASPAPTSSEATEPAPDYKAVDPKTGKPMYVYSLEYTMEEDGKNETWEFRFWAFDAEDAERRVQAVKATSVLLGQVLRDQSPP
jgi:hypothetical protein